MDGSDSIVDSPKGNVIDLTTQVEEHPAIEEQEKQSLPVRTLLQKYRVKETKKELSRKKKPGIAKQVKSLPGNDQTSEDNADRPHKPSRKPLSKKVQMRKQRERATKCRLKRRTTAFLRKQVDQGLFNSLLKIMTSSARGKRTYTPTLVELVARVGRAPSAGGARAPLAGIIKHITGGLRTGYALQATL